MTRHSPKDQETSRQSAQVPCPHRSCDRGLRRIRVVEIQRCQATTGIRERACLLRELVCCSQNPFIFCLSLLLGPGFGTLPQASGPVSKPSCHRDGYSTLYSSQQGCVKFVKPVEQCVLDYKAGKSATRAKYYGNQRVRFHREVEVLVCSLDLGSVGCEVATKPILIVQVCT